MKPEQLLKSIEDAAPGKGWPIIGPKRGLLLDEVIATYRPSSILEVGTNVGYSAIRMARHLDAGGKLICVEIREDMAKAARSNFENAGLSDRIEVVVGDALKVLPTLDGRFDMVFLDAVKEDYLVYLSSIERLLHKGSVVVADNVKSHAAEVGSYLEYVRKSGLYDSAYREASPNWGTDAGDAVEISVRL
ncbi:MAG: O-methyltransferase [Nitrososphaerota archaeon]|nr:O-methyltransferase [Nitrososphaerota archaeon]MDG7030355.1 O-methyltransferase [Nitrososphaerota archaeon]